MSHALDQTYGVTFLGVIFSADPWFIHLSTYHLLSRSVALVQAWYYFTHQSDTWPLKLFVACVVAFDTIHQALIVHAVWSMVVEVLFNGLTALFVQAFLILRIWRLSKGNILLTGSAGALCVGNFAYVAKALPMTTFAELTTIKGLSLAINITGAATDVLIAAILCFLLLGSRTGFSRSDSMINKLVLFFVNTGLITSVFAIASLISITTAPDAFIYILFFFCMGRLYSNSLLAVLNARKSIKESSGSGVHTSGDMPLSWRRPTGTLTNPPLEVKIATSHETDDTIARDFKQRGSQ
ncbi:hypothetical protein FB45DRAFT_926163 [Roridomyces roridus]|uniref:DUF6534 domain-containing protein n=1 Tax=Roridomyces roridus TaxID=1738132 RepID=A0AAD7BKU7_9AGAR|nr:hypothetical protein FB45DRAFT_926163 [Roridomyces roridus]